MGNFPKWLRMRVGKKRGWKCEYPGCNRSFKDGFLLEFHHKIATSMGGEDTEENCQILCIYHHLKVHEKMARDGTGHPDSPRLIRARLNATGGRTREWLRKNGGAK